MIDLSLYLITTEVASLGRTHIDVARAGIEGGATVIQFREKEKDDDFIYRVAREIRELTCKAGVLFIVNDRVDVAVAVDADGVHVGQSDMPAREVLKLLGEGKVVGVSATSVEEAVRAEQDGASYLGVGPIFPTPSKADACPPIGCEVLAQIRQSVKIPIVAIGGIGPENVKEVMRAGADGIAVISAVACAPDMVWALRELGARVREYKQSDRSLEGEENEGR